ncbi:MAG: hypothetical protein Unbinned1819contig1001_55 [Prokaryotic dsDNA virus sp.]|nr:MAG: hypothetical protein Unbinned1819contig1001_55 [Prokaryotic dsDNA virus sp.]|tara:strand:+ start:30761 stop:31081 length:321 start_codon:yes stop_codon:yes gene_type:complete
MAQKSTNTEVDARIHAVYDLLLKSYSRSQIVRHCAENWDIHERQAENYIARARKLIHLDAEMERSQWLAQAVARLANYERQGVDASQLQVAIRALELQAKLLQFDI